jgi:hypothetical protein
VDAAAQHAAQRSTRVLAAAFEPTDKQSIAVAQYIADNNQPHFYSGASNDNNNNSAALCAASAGAAQSAPATRGGTWARMSRAPMWRGAGLTGQAGGERFGA